jgi:hypothetical protein
MNDTLPSLNVKFHEANDENKAFDFMLRIGVLACRYSTIVFARTTSATSGRENPFTGQKAVSGFPNG